MSTDSSNMPTGLPESEHRRYGRILLTVLAAGVLFLGGQGARWWQEQARLGHLDATLDAVYQRALGGVPGRSPYGRLQFELGKLRAGSAQQLDLLELLAALSRRAPAGVRVESVSMNGRSGVVVGVASTRAEFERYQAGLAAESSFSFSSNRVSPGAEPVRFELAVKARDRTAPPQEDF
jgi:hypothetical protein